MCARVGHWPLFRRRTNAPPTVYASTRKATALYHARQHDGALSFYVFVCFCFLVDMATLFNKITRIFLQISYPVGAVPLKNFLRLSGWGGLDAHVRVLLSVSQHSVLSHKHARKDFLKGISIVSGLHTSWFYFKTTLVWNTPPPTHWCPFFNNSFLKACEQSQKHNDYRVGRCRVQ